MNTEQFDRATEQFEEVRQAGPCNMLDQNCVQRYAFDNDMHELVVAIEEDRYIDIIESYERE